jgi:hypothetical protein
MGETERTGESPSTSTAKRFNFNDTLVVNPFDVTYVIGTVEAS